MNLTLQPRQNSHALILSNDTTLICEGKQNKQARIGSTEVSLYKKEKAETFVSAFIKDLAATYSRGSYTTTTIGKTAFDGRVRDGNGSDHSFITTKSLSRRPHADLPQRQQCFCTATIWT